MTRHPGEMSWSFGPGPAAVERRMRAVRALVAHIRAEHFTD